MRCSFKRYVDMSVVGGTACHSLRPSVAGADLGAFPDWDHLLRHLPRSPTSSTRIACIIALRRLVPGLFCRPCESTSLFTASARRHPTTAMQRNTMRVVGDGRRLHARHALRRAVREAAASGRVTPGDGCRLLQMLTVSSQVPPAGSIASGPKTLHSLA